MHQGQFLGWKVTWSPARPGLPWTAVKAGVRLMARTSTELERVVVAAEGEAKERRAGTPKDLGKNGVPRG